jgi:hypothetical protein
MSEQLKSTISADGFDDDAGGGTDQVRVIIGEKWSFSGEGTWVNADEELILPNREVVVVRIARVLQKWVDQCPVHEATKFLAPGESVDIEGLNDECPRAEWTEDLNGKPRGPWQVQSIVYMVDPANMQRFTYPTSTVGGNIAIGELKDAVNLMRKFRGAGICPVVTLATKHMKTKFGGRQRPHFAILRWFSFDGGAPPMQLPAGPAPKRLGPDQSAAPAPAPAKRDAIDMLVGGTIVEEPTLREQLNDKIPW